MAVAPGATALTVTSAPRSSSDAATIDQIAERADVARQTVLNHYPAKKDFVAAWGERRRNDDPGYDLRQALNDRLDLLLNGLGRA